MPLLSFIAPLAGRVCKRLDGVPLAIELAAARAAILGIEVLVEKVDESIRILGGGRRTALPHHQTLEASFDLSYNFLSETERKMLSRLGVLPGAFILKDNGGDLRIDREVSRRRTSRTRACRVQSVGDHPMLRIATPRGQWRTKRDEVEASPVPVQSVLRYSWQLD
jgi:hypothetical protein